MPRGRAKASASQPSRGRASRGGRGGRGGNKRSSRTKSATAHSSAPQPSSNQVEQMEKDVPNDEELDIEKDVKKFFLGVASFDKHCEAQNKSPWRYCAALALLYKTGIELSPNARVRALAAAWSRRDRAMASAMLSLRDAFGLVEVLKALTILDSGRQIRQLQAQLARLQAQADKRGKPLRRGLQTKFKVKIDNLTAIRPSQGSVSGALARQVRAWVAGGFSREELEFFALQMPPEPWRKLADLVHLNPTRDFASLPWFLSFCHGQPAPDDSVINRARTLTKENVNELLSEVSLPYTCLREAYLKELNEASKAAIVRGEDRVDRGIWWYEELQCPAVEAVIQERLETQHEQVTLNYGKLMERLVTFKKLKQVPSFFPLLVKQAELKLESTALCLESPIVVLADASSSMNVAIETATIVSSLLTAVAQAELVFFNDTCWRPASAPRSIDDVIRLALETRATRSTAPAAALYPYYESKQVVRTFIVVTDEEENTRCQGFYFDQLFARYREEVSADVQLIFISFLRSQTCAGDMVPKLRSRDVPVRQFVMSRQRPDLTKLDNILGQLAAQTQDFEEALRSLQAQMENEGLEKMFREICQAAGKSNLAESGSGDAK